MSVESAVVNIPLGLTLLYGTFRGQQEHFIQIAWSPDGQMLASLSDDSIIRLWHLGSEHPYRTLKVGLITGYSMIWSPDGSTLALGNLNNLILLNRETGQQLLELAGHLDVVNSIAWSPNGEVLASGSDDKTIQLWDAKSGHSLWTLTGHSDVVNSVIWSPSGESLISGSSDGTIILWDPKKGKVLGQVNDYSRKVMSLIWSPDGRMLASLSDDETIGLRDASTGRQVGILEGHTSRVTGITFAFDGRLLASKAQDGSVRFWHSSTWETAAVFQKPPLDWWSPCLAFHPKAPILATLNENDTVIQIWNIDFDTLLKTTSGIRSIYYTNAKIVLMGDTGVGKSGLGLVLTNQPFVPTDSTHGRRVWTFENQEVELIDGRREIHETLLWDLAGQPGYRLIHQLHLNEVAIALVVFDARNETDPFAGVYYWNRALSQAQQVQGNSSAPTTKKLLVAARIDRGGRAVSNSRIVSLLNDLGFEAYFETSAKEGWGIAELVKAIQGSIDWTSFPKVSSTELFQQIKDFLVAEKEVGQIILTVDNLYRSFMKSRKTSGDTEEGLRAQFETCIGRVESRGLIRRLSFGDFILLQPEILDSYASALINAVKEEPDGLGSIVEKRAQSGDFRMPKDERLQDREQEKLLLIAMVDDLLRHEIALRESAGDGPYLVFPSQSMRESPDLPDPEGKAVVISFHGSVLNIYATLTVRLSHSGMFEMKELWKDAITYTTKVGGKCGILLKNMGEGRGELTLFFDNEASEQTCFHFEEYVHTHLQRRALPESIQRRRVFVCPGHECGFVVPDQLVNLRLARSYDWLECPNCSTRISLLDREERLSVTHKSLILEMDHTADNQREREAAASVRHGLLQENIEFRSFDVFLCHNSNDKSEVKKIGKWLKERGIVPWLDDWELRPGLPWQRLLEKQIGQIKSAAVFVGKDGIGPWQQMELDALLREFVNRGCPVIPVLLPDASKEPELPIFLRGMMWVDFRKQNPNPMERFIWGITGKRVSEQ